MLGEIEHLQSVLADIIKQTISPSTLPLAGEDLVRDFRLSDHHNYDDQVGENTIQLTKELEMNFTLRNVNLGPMACLFHHVCRGTPETGHEKCYFDDAPPQRSI